MKQRVVVVDEKDNVLGTEEKLKAHQNGGILHRAFSLFLFNSKGEMLLQQRAFSKYHCGGLWTNACCSHPLLEKSVEDFARERLQYEMGMGCNDIGFLYTFLYKKDFENGLTEHELDHVLFAVTDEEPNPSKHEVSDTQWISLEDLYEDLKNNPSQYTYWFRLICQNEQFKKTFL